jgi:C6 transcription factor Pro1
MEVTVSTHHPSTMRSSNGCWTSKLRRKKCDEHQPVCDTCTALHITCHYGHDKPEWMDGGTRQEDMVATLKHEVRANAHLRRIELPVNTAGNCVSNVQYENMESNAEPLRMVANCGPDSTSTCNDPRHRSPFKRSDTVLLMFYLEQVLPFVFPFYRPSPLQGGKSWILEMMISSPVVRQAVLCQSSYFFSIAQGTPNHDVLWETVLLQSRDTFEVLGQAIRVLHSSDITEHWPGAVRILASITQVQRFEIAILSFENCQAHLNAAVSLFKQLLESTGFVATLGVKSSFDTIIGHLGSSSRILPTQDIEIPSAEQAAFQFSSALLILDDIISSTVFQEEPRLYKYHRGLLSTSDSTDPPINLEAVTGGQNWVFLQIGEIAVLDAWKQQCKRAGNLDVMELVRRATDIKDSLVAHLTFVESDSATVPEKGSIPSDVFMTDGCGYSKTLASQSSLVTQVWAYAALLYLSVVVSGWQSANLDVQGHVTRIIDLLMNQTSPLALVRTMVWPFCVAGCLAEPAQEASFLRVVEKLQPPSAFRTVRKALELMENVWRNRFADDAANRDLASCFRSQYDLVLLV